MFNNLQIDTVTNNILNMVIFDKMKIGNPIIDMIVTNKCILYILFINLNIYINKYIIKIIMI